MTGIDLHRNLRNRHLYGIFLLQYWGQLNCNFWVLSVIWTLIQKAVFPKSYEYRLQQFLKKYSQLSHLETIIVTSLLQVIQNAHPSSENIEVLNRSYLRFWTTKRLYLLSVILLQTFAHIYSLSGPSFIIVSQELSIYH